MGLEEQRIQSIRQGKLSRGIHKDNLLQNLLADESGHRLFRAEAYLSHLSRHSHHHTLYTRPDARVFVVGFLSQLLF